MATFPQRLRTGGYFWISTCPFFASSPIFPAHPPLPHPWTQCWVNLAEETKTETQGSEHLYCCTGEILYFLRICVKQSSASQT